MKQVIITAFPLLYFSTATLTNDEVFGILPRSLGNFPDVVPRYIKAYPVSKESLNFLGRLHRRRTDDSLPFPMKAHFFHRDLDIPTTIIERRSAMQRTNSQSQQRAGSKEGSTASTIPLAPNQPSQEHHRKGFGEQDDPNSSYESSRSPHRSRDRSSSGEKSQNPHRSRGRSTSRESSPSPRRNSESRNSAQGQAKVLMQKKGEGAVFSAAPYIDNHAALEPHPSDVSWKGLTSEKVTGVALGRDNNEKLKLDVMGQKTIGEVNMFGQGNAILRSHDPQRGTNTKMLIGGPKDHEELGHPKHQAVVEAASDDPNKKASVSIETTSFAHARVRGTTNKNDDISFKPESY